MNMKNKLLCVLSAFVLIPTIAFAAPSTVKVVVNGKPIVTDTPAVIRNSRTMVPFRALFESLGAKEITWDEPTQTVTGSDGNTTIKMVIGSYDIDVNGNNITMDTPPMIINSRTMIPMSAVSTAMGSNVHWDAGTYTATVTKDGAPTDVANNPKPSDSVFPDIPTNIPSNDGKSGFDNIQSNNIINKNLTGFYALEDLNRNKYVTQFSNNSALSMINIKTLKEIKGSYTINKTDLGLNITGFNKLYKRQDFTYDGNTIILMKDASNPEAGTTFAMMSISETEYKKYIKK